MDEMHEPKSYISDRLQVHYNMGDSYSASPFPKLTEKVAFIEIQPLS